MAEVKTISLVNGVTVTAPNDLSSQSGGGGGGGGLQWNPVSGEAPQSQEEFGQLVYLFEDTIAQTLSVFVKVPSSYLAGNQVNMRLSIYSPASSGTMLMGTTSYLIRKDVTEVDSTLNSYASTNSAVTNTVANQYREITLDLSDSSGEINSVAIEPGDMIRVDLVRSGGSDTADTRFIPSSTEVTFI